MSERSHREDIDGLRGVAIALAIAYHLSSRRFPNAYLGVDLFFAISGFVVTRALERAAPSGGLVSFYIRRVKRLLPALYVSLLATVLLAALVVPPAALSEVWPTGAAALAAAGNLQLLRDGLSYFGVEVARNPFTHTWSLGIEEQFYLVFPGALALAGLASRRLRVAGRGALISAALLLSLARWHRLLDADPMAAFYDPGARAWELLAGVLAALAAAPRLALAPRARAAAQLLGPAAIAASLFVPSARASSPWPAALMVLGACALLASGDLGGAAAAALSLPPLPSLGRLSYSLYLWQNPLLTIAGWNWDLSRPAAQAAALAAVFAAALLSYAWVEQPLRRHPRQDWAVLGLGLAGGLGVLALGSACAGGAGRLYLGHAEAYAGLWPHPWQPAVASMRGTQRECHLPTQDPIPDGALDRCLVRGRSGRTVYLFGNSHAEELLPALSLAHERDGWGFAGLTSSGCLLTAAPTTESWSSGCSEYFRYMSRELEKRARPGDVVLISARAMLRAPREAAAASESEYTRDGRPLTRRQAHELANAELAGLAARLGARGVPVAFAGTLPHRVIDWPQVCVPEWFRPARADCAPSRESIAAEGAGYRADVEAIAAASGNASYWDPLPVFCGPERCPLAEGRVLLMRDASHLSLAGAAKLGPALADFLARVPRPRRLTGGGPGAIVRADH